MNDTISNGTREVRAGELRVYYDGYWVKCYPPPNDTLAAKKQLIQSLTRRLFNHMEHGINIPGRLLDTVRVVYETETDPHKKRVKGAMLAGALFNRAADIFNHLVELEAIGVKIQPDDNLMHTCGLCLREALEFGKMVKHRNGDEGIDELWGEPFKAFIMPIDEFYETRYMKISMTMKNIDQVASFMAQCTSTDPRFPGMEPLLEKLATTAKHKCEILRTDEDIFDVWSDFVVAGEAIKDYVPTEVEHSDQKRIHIIDAKHMLKEGVRLIGFITRARTPMPLSTKNFLNECQLYKSRAS
jgi:hypothetical protein